MNTMNHTLLFDVDGILLRNRTISELVTFRSICFLKDHKRFQEMYKLSFPSFKFANKINSLSYPSLGHTSFIIENSEECAKAYNDYVFDDNTLFFIRNNLTNADFEHLNNIERILNDRDDVHLHIGLCTNAPLRYCEAVLYPGYSGSSFKNELLSNAFTSDSGLLKPNDNFYEAVEKALPDSNIHFIDDSFVNTNTVSERDRWFPMCVPQSENCEDILYNALELLTSSLKSY